MDIFPTNTISTNVTSTVPINCHNKNKIYYQLYFVFIYFINHSTDYNTITFVYHCHINKSKQKHVDTLTT